MVALKAPRGTIQEPLFVPDSDWRPPSMAELPSWKGVKRIAYDLETKDSHLKELGPGVRRPGNFVCGFSFCIEDGPKRYLPIRHEGGDNLDAAQVIQYLKDQAKVFDGDLVGMNISYDIDWSLQEGIEFKPRFFRDIMIAEPLIDENQRSYAMKAIAQRYSIPGKDQRLLEEAAAAYGVDPKGGMWRLPARFVGAYGERDSELPLQILRRQERIIEEQELEQIWDLESRVLPVLVRMRRRGVRFSWERLRGIETWSIDEETSALAEVRQHTGVTIPLGEVWKPEHYANAIRALGLEVPKTADGADSVTKELLDRIDHPAAKALKKAREVNKLRTTFAASIRRFAVGDRIHPTFNQLRATKDEDADSDDPDAKGGRYGRLSSELPNIQQQPVRGEFAKPWRKVYIADDGLLFGSADYSQQEPRWTTHYAELTNQPRAKEAGQRYRDDPTTDNHDMMTRLVHDAAVDIWLANDPARYKKERGFCKELYLGKCYRMGGAKLCRKLKLPTRFAVFWRERGKQATYFDDWTSAREALKLGGGEGFVSEVAGEEGQRIIDKFDAQAPFLKSLANMVEKRAAENGFIRTVLGRKCRFPLRQDGTYDWCHKALNRLIQGCSADQTKKAMVDLDAAGFPLQLQVHDEICMSTTGIEQMKDVAQIMQDCVTSLVPFKVDVEIGPSWGEAK